MTDRINRRTSSPAAADNRHWRTTAADFARQRWYLLAVVAIVVVLATWALFRGGSDGDTGASAPETAAAPSAASDSVLKLDSTAQRLAGVELLTVTSSDAGVLTANGTITYDANRVSIIAPRVEGRVASVRADLGQQVRPGTVLAVIESSEAGEIRGDLERARANVDVARRNFEREKRLYEEQITPQKEMLEAEAAFRSAEADYNSALARLRAIGADGGTGATFGLSTPVGGTVVERNASPGLTVNPSTNLFTVADLRSVWITVDVYEGDYARVRTGAGAMVLPTALPGASFAGRVTYAGGIVDPASRTFKVRVEVSNAGLRLRPGMFAQVRIQTPQSSTASNGAESANSAVVIPEIAVQEVGGKQVVFVATGTPGAFVVRSVVVGSRAGSGMVAVTSGLAAGETIVTKGAFQLKSELTKASFGEDD